MGICTGMAVGCPPRSGVATGVSVSVVSAVAVGEVAGTCAGPGCSVSHAAAAMSRRVARIRFRIGDSSRSLFLGPAHPDAVGALSFESQWDHNSGQRRPRDLHCRFRWRWACARRESP